MNFGHSHSEYPKTLADGNAGKISNAGDGESGENGYRNDGCEKCHLDNMEAKIDANRNGDCHARPTSSPLETRKTGK